MANAQFIDAQDADFEEYTVTNAPMTSADMATESLVAALNDVSGSGTVSIHRQNGSGKEALTFLDSFAPDKYAPDDLLLHIKNTYGSGDYRIHVRENGKLKANRHVSIEAPIVSRETPNNNGDINALIQFMQQHQAQMLQAIREQQASISSEDQMIERMLKYKALFGGDSTQQKHGGFAEIIQTVNGLKELGINVGGIQTEKEEGFGDIIDRMSPMLTALIQQGAQQPQPQPQAQPKYKPNPQPREKNEMQLALKMGLAMLIKAAKNNADTAFYADLVLDQLPADKIELLLVPDALEQLQKIEPKIAQFKEWFADVLEHIKGMNGVESKYSEQYKSELTPDDESVINGESEKTTGD